MLSILFATFAAASASELWSVDTRCPMAMNTGSVGSCKIWPCSADRGPAHCTLGSCYCNDGYCRYPHSTLHIQARYCVARIPAATCHVSRICWSGGLTRSFCESGLCMCKWGYKAEQDGSSYNCVANGDDPNKYPNPGGGCDTSTGGTCGWFGCDTSRNSQCVGGKCVCRDGQCANNGVCTSPPGDLLAASTNATNDMSLAEMEELRKYDDWKVMMNMVGFATWVGAATGVLVGGALLLRRKFRSSGDEDMYKAMGDGCHE